ncbi:MAG: spore cortex-lytic enzyme [Bacillota bacterium]
MEKLIKKHYKAVSLCLVLITLFVFGIFIYNTRAEKSLLFWGSRNNDVLVLQRKLREWGYYEGVIDGVYGRDTWVAVREFQSKNGLRADGLVGPQTWAALGYEYGGRENPRSQPAQAVTSGSVDRSNNVEMIARLIHAEARGEPYTGQVAVGAVLLNRVESPAFPNSISRVIYQPLAFESVANGQFNLPPTEENKRAARAAINGWDPTYGSLFFWNPSKPVNKWIWSRSTVRTIGSHVFAH